MNFLKPYLEKAVDFEDYEVSVHMRFVDTEIPYCYYPRSSLETCFQCF